MESVAKSQTALFVYAGRILAVLVALLLGSAGVLKLFSYPPFVQVYVQAGQPNWVFYGSGIVECICSVGLLLPRTRLYSAWGLLAMIFLVSWKPWSVHQMLFLLPQCFAIAMLIALVWPLRLPPRSRI
jgi:uncharacterized membrane protein